MTLLSPIRFLIYPLHGEVREHVRIEFLSRMLSQRVNRPVVMEVARTYEYLDQELAANRVDIALATAEQCSRYEPTSRAVLRAVRSGRWFYHSAFICRVEEPLTLEMLRGTRAAWVTPFSAGGYLLARQYLEDLGFSLSELFAEQRFYGTYRQALLAVLSGEADVTSQITTHTDEYTTRARMAERIGQDERRLKPFAYTPPTLSDGIILTNRLTEAEASTLVAAITGMAYEEGNSAPSLSPFDIEGFTLVKAPMAPLPVSRGSWRTEVLTLDLDEEERCHRVWSSTGKAFGQEIRQGEGRLLMEFLPPEASIPLESLARATRHSGVNGRVQFRMESSSGARMYAAETALRPPTPEDPNPHLAMVVSDVTGLEALQQDVYRLASFPLLHPDPMLELGPDGQLRYANPAAHTAFPDLLTLGTEHPLVKAAFQHAQRSGPNQAPELFQREGRYWEVVTMPLQDHESLRVFAKDVTERKQMEASLLQADRRLALGSLAARVGHQMNNPLAFLMANLTFAREEIGRLRELMHAGKAEMAQQDVDEVIDALSEASEGAERLKMIVQDLRLLTREPPRYRTRVNVNPVLEDTLKLVRSELHHRIRLEKDFQSVPLVEADEARLGQVFLNLVLNAVQAMTKQDAGRNVLRVASRTSENGEVIVEVQDTGVGMTPEVLSSLFEPFFTTRPNSVGMGLSVSHAIVTSLGGTLRAESQPGVGTLFTVVLPPAGKSPAASPSQHEQELAS